MRGGSSGSPGAPRSTSPMACSQGGRQQPARDVDLRPDADEQRRPGLPACSLPGRHRAAGDRGRADPPLAARPAGRPAEPGAAGGPADPGAGPAGPPSVFGGGAVRRPRRDLPGNAPQGDWDELPGAGFAKRTAVRSPCRRPVDTGMVRPPNGGQSDRSVVVSASRVSTSPSAGLLGLQAAAGAGPFRLRGTSVNPGGPSRRSATAPRMRRPCSSLVVRPKPLLPCG